MFSFSHLRLTSPFSKSHFEGGKLLGAIVKSLSKEDVAKAKINAASAAPFLGKESFDDFVKKAEVGDKF